MSRQSRSLDDRPTAARAARALLLAALIALLPVTAGCLGTDTTDPSESGEGADEGDAIGADGSTSMEPEVLPDLYGFVTDRSKAPLEGVLVEVQNSDLSTHTDATGRYGFDGLEPDVELVLLTTLEGYDRQARLVRTVENASVRLDFELVAKPTERPFHQSDDRVAFLACQLNVAAGHDHGKEGEDLYQDCGGQDTNNQDAIEFPIARDAAAIVVDVRWNARSDLASTLAVEAETVGFGDLDRSLGEVIGPSVLTFSVSQQIVEKYYKGQGGVLRVMAYAHPEDDDEQAAGAALHLQQEVDIVVTVFYFAPSPPGWSYFVDGDGAPS